MSTTEYNLNQKVQDIYSKIQEIDLSKSDAHEQMMKTIAHYDQLFQQQFNHPTPQQLGQSFKEQDSRIELPEKGTDLEKKIKSQFIADGSIFGEYQQMMRQAKIPSYSEPLHVDEEAQQKQELANQFIRIPNNYQNTNANSKMAVNQINCPIREQQDKFYEQQVNLQQVLPSVKEEDFLQKIKKTVNTLGGIEDTLQVMKQSLNDYEEQHIIKTQQTVGPIFKESTLKPNQSMLTQSKPQFHPFEKYIATEQTRPIQIFNESQMLRKQKQQLIQFNDIQ